MVDNTKYFISRNDLKFQIFKYILIFSKCEIFARVRQALIISGTMTNIYLNAAYAELQMWWNTDKGFAWRSLRNSSKCSPSVPLAQEVGVERLQRTLARPMGNTIYCK
jgi:hypothetical protein